MMMMYDDSLIEGCAYIQVDWRRMDGCIYVCIYIHNIDRRTGEGGMDGGRIRVHTYIRTYIQM